MELDNRLVMLRLGEGHGLDLQLSRFPDNDSFHQLPGLHGHTRYVGAPDAGPSLTRPMMGVMRKGLNRI
ncbi:hypothetical protein GCM10023232_14750 [Sphingosinicella ginsenosidimutans]